MINRFGVVKIRESLSDYFYFSRTCEQRVRGMGGWRWEEGGSVVN